MTTRELIAQLESADPSGEMDVCFVCKQRSDGYVEVFPVMGLDEQPVDDLPDYFHPYFGVVLTHVSRWRRPQLTKRRL